MGIKQIFSCCSFRLSIGRVGRPKDVRWPRDKPCRSRRCGTRSHLVRSSSEGPLSFGNCLQPRAQRPLTLETTLGGAPPQTHGSVETASASARRRTPQQCQAGHARRLRRQTSASMLVAGAAAVLDQTRMRKDPSLAAALHVRAGKLVVFVGRSLRDEPEVSQHDSLGDRHEAIAVLTDAKTAISAHGLCRAEAPMGYGVPRIAIAGLTPRAWQCAIPSGVETKRSTAPFRIS